MVKSAHLRHTAQQCTQASFWDVVDQALCQPDSPHIWVKSCIQQGSSADGGAGAAGRCAPAVCLITAQGADSSSRWQCRQAPVGMTGGAAAQAGPVSSRTCRDAWGVIVLVVLVSRSADALIAQPCYACQCSSHTYGHVASSWCADEKGPIQIYKHVYPPASIKSFCHCGWLRSVATAFQLPTARGCFLRASPAYRPIRAALTQTGNLAS